MKKMVVNHIDKIFVTSDAAVIMREVLSSEYHLELTVFNTDGSPSSCRQNDLYGL